MKKLMLVALWLPLITIAFLGCKKNTNTITAPYQVRTYPGNYQFGGTVNGQEFIANGSTGWFAGFQAIESTFWIPSSAGGLEKDFHCGIYSYSGPNEIFLNYISFNIKNFIGVGRYNLNKLTSPFGYTGRADTYGGFKIDTSGGNKKYFLTNNYGDTGYVDCKRWSNENDFEFSFKYTCRNSVVGDTDRSTKTIEGTVIRKP